MNRKKIILLIVAFIITASTSIIVNAEGSKNLQTCTTEPRTYYFAEGSSNKGQVQTTSYTTTFHDELPRDEGEVQITSINVTPENMQLSDFKSYSTLVNSGDCTGVGPSGAPICKDAENMLYTNSGADIWGGINVEEMGVDEYYNTKIVHPTSTDITCAPSSTEGVVECTVSRTWDDSSYSGNGYIVPVKATVTIDYLAENCDNPVEDNTCGATDSGLTLNKTSCGSNSYEGAKTETFNIERTISEGDTDFSIHKSNDSRYSDKGNGTGTSCSTDITQELNGSATIKQTGKATIRSSPYSIYAGGGFDFDVNYIGNAKYDICGAVNYTTTEEYAEYSCDNYEYSRGNITYEAVSTGQNGKICEIYKITEETRTRTLEEDESTSGCDRVRGDICYYTEQVREYDRTENATFTCESATTGNGTCSQNGNVLNCGGTDGEGETAEVAKHMAQYIEIPTSDNYELNARDSNDANVATTGVEWYTWNTNGTKPNSWNPDTYVTYTVSMEQKQACINIYTAKVRYTDRNCETNEIDGEELYYVPLKYFESTFNIDISLPELSIINLMNWSLNSSCGPSCYQKLYKEDGGFKFIYRPIDMSDPFPNNRQPGSNWSTFMQDLENGTASEKTYAQNKMTRDQTGLEYHGILTQDKIMLINSYNTYKYPILNENVVAPSGKSLLNFSNWGITRQNNNNYNELGKCSTNGATKCWLSE